MPKFTDTMDGVTIGIIDASLAMMSAVVAAQSAGLGSNCIGYLRTADPAKIAEAPQTSEGSVCGLRSCNRCAPRAARSEAEAAEAADDPQEPLPSGQRQDG